MIESALVNNVLRTNFKAKWVRVAVLVTISLAVGVFFVTEFVLGQMQIGEAVSKIESIGGTTSVFTDWRGRPEQIDLGVYGLPPPTILEDDLIEIFDVLGCCIKELDCNLATVNDETMRPIGQLERLESLWLSGNNISDLGLRQLRKLSTLRHLYLDSTNITDDGLKYLEDMTELRTLSLARTNTTEAARNSLKTKLSKLQIDVTRDYTDS